MRECLHTSAKEKEWGSGKAAISSVSSKLKKKMTCPDV